MQTSTKPTSGKHRSRRPWMAHLIWMSLAASVAAADDATVRPAQTTYGLTQLSAETIIFLDINSSGQVAFTEYIDGVRRAKFYDGRTVRDLGTLGGPNATAVALNDWGQVTGSADVDAAGTLSHAYRWSRQTGMVDLSGRGRGASSGNDINNRGQVTRGAVFGRAANTYQHAFLWSPQTGMVDIGTVDWSAHGDVINDAGTVAGTTGGNSVNAFRWTRRDGMRVITAMGNEFDIATDINAAGHIVGGTGITTSLPPHAYLWTPREGLIDLGAGIPDRTQADKVNDTDMVILNVRNFTDTSHGYIWTRDRGLTEIGAGAPSIGTGVADLNNRGQVVGRYADYAFVWTRAQGVVDLNTRLRGVPDGIKLTWAGAISENGIIAAGSNTGLVLLDPAVRSGNQPPIAAQIVATGQAGVNALLTFAADFRDPDLRDTHRATWTWGDGSTDRATVSERRGSGSVSGQHAFRSAGSHTVRLTVTDSSGRSTTVKRTLTVEGTGSAAPAYR